MLIKLPITKKNKIIFDSFILNNDNNKIDNDNRINKKIIII